MYLYSAWEEILGKPTGTQTFEKQVYKGATLLIPSTDALSIEKV